LSSNRNQAFAISPCCWLGLFLSIQSTGTPAFHSLHALIHLIGTSGKRRTKKRGNSKWTFDNIHNMVMYGFKTPCELWMLKINSHLAWPKSYIAFHINDCCGRIGGKQREFTIAIRGFCELVDVFASLPVQSFPSSCPNTHVTCTCFEAIHN
jgi:hypothetical protein